MALSHVIGLTVGSTPEFGILGDGIGVPVTEAEGRPGKGEDGTARTREVKMDGAFTQTATDEDGRPVGDLAFSSYVDHLPVGRRASAPSWPPRRRPHPLDGHP